MVKFYALVALLVINAHSQSFSRFENFSSTDYQWLMKLSNDDKINGISNVTTSEYNAIQIRVNSSLCEIRGKVLTKETEKQRVKEDDNGKYWYDKIPTPPIAVATSDTIPEGACKRQLKRYIKDLRNGTLWAVQMFDASAKYPYGIIDGQTRHLGSFDQCYKFQARLPNKRKSNADDFDEMQGRYCLVDFKYKMKNAFAKFHGRLDFKFDPTDSVWEAVRQRGDFRRQPREVIQMALCVPAACSAADVLKALRGPYEKYAAENNMIIKMSIDEKHCQAYREEPAFSIGAIVYCVVLLSIFALLFISSLYDSTLQTEEDKRNTSKFGEFLLCFSVRRNLQSVFHVSYNHRGLDTIHMLRFFSTVLVIVGHRMMLYYFNPVVNRSYFELTFEVPSFIMVHNGPIIVDAFFGIGGLLACYGLLYQFDVTKKKNFVALTFIRFLRFTPAYALAIFFYAYPFQYMGSGPEWSARIVNEAENCAATWWANLFYLNNYLSTDRLCMFQSWYLSVDFHCYAIAVYLIYAFWKLPRRIGYSILGAATFVSILIPFYYTYVHRIQPLFIGFAHITNLSLDPYFSNYYVKTHMRISSYLVGVIAGAILYDYEKQKSPWRISKRWSQVLFILLVVVMSLYSQGLGFQYFNPNSNPSSLEMALYACLHRVAFSASFCFIILLITIGDGLDFHYNFLTPRWVQPLSRLTYGVFLSHNILQTYHSATMRTATVFSIHNSFWNIVPDVTYSYVFALLISIGIEGPFRKLEKYFITKRKEKVTNNKNIKEEQTSEIETKKTD